MHAPIQHFDVLIIGAGLSGIGAAHHLQERCPGKSYAILEGRDAIGGTWDLFRYPGIRSDSDMYTLGYGFRPWREAKAIADGPSILSYVRDTADEYDINKHIRFDHWVTDAEWSSAEARWTVTASHNGASVRYSCNFLWMCSGYYRYSAGHTPDFPDAEKFSGQIVHPQHWPEDLDYTGKKVVVIGSGATAVTLIPSMADKTEHITMLQRSPTYMYAMPATSPLANFLNRFLPSSMAYRIMRWQRVLLQQFVFKWSRVRPKKMAQRLIDMTRERLPDNFDVEKHFTPSYNPWDQRLCLVPDDDLFETLSSGRASVVTDHIERFTEQGIALKSGEHLDADIIITATGLNLEVFGGARLVVDGQEMNAADLFIYKGMMYSDVPNLASVFGYTNASWTLRADLICEYVCKLINYMEQNGHDICTPRVHDPDMQTESFMNLSSGYVQRAAKSLPKQGTEKPWRNPQNYFVDLFELRGGKIDDGVLLFSKANADAGNVERPVNIAAE